jgi:hypothetical protein
LTVGTGLLLAEGALLLLLFLFVWAVVRSASSQLKKAPPSMAAPLPPTATDTDPHLGPEPDQGPEPEPAAPAAEPEPVPVAMEPAPPQTIDLAALEAAAEPAPQPIRLEPVPESVSESAEIRRQARARRGFNLSENVRPRFIVARSPSLATGTEIELDGGVTIGRSRGSELPIADAYVSHTHARVFRRGQFFFIEDLGSSNGTFLNGTRIGREAQLKVMDEVRMGETVLRYEE